MVACTKPAKTEKTPAAISHEQALLVSQLKTLIDITYDKPELCIGKPDSLLATISVLPVYTEAQTLYTSLLVNIGFCLKDEGYVLKSIVFFEKAFTYYQEYKPVGVDFYNYIAKPLGNLYTRTGDFEKAVLVQQFAINTAITDKRTDILPSLYNNAAITFLQTRQHRQAQEACAKGLLLIEKPNTTSGQLYNTLAESFERIGSIDSAILYNRMALEIFKERDFAGDTSIWQFSAFQLESILQKDKQDFNLALLPINKAIAIAEQNFANTKSREKAKLYEIRGDLFLQLKDIPKAKNDFQHVLSLFGISTGNIIFPDNTVSDALLGLARCHQHANPDSAAYFYSNAIENDYLVQQFIVNKHSSYYNSSGNRKVLTEAMAFMWPLYQQGREELAIRMLWLTELSKGRQLLMEINRTQNWGRNADSTRQSAMEQLMFLHKEIASARDQAYLKQLEEQARNISFKFQLSEKYAETYFERPSLKSFTESLHKQLQQTDMVSWLINDSTDHYVFLLSGNKIMVKQLRENALRDVNINGFLTTYFKSGPQHYNNDPELYASVSEQILTTLIPDVKFLSKKRLMLSADGILSSIPVDALCHKAKFWVTEKDISYTYTFLSGLGQKTVRYHSGIDIFVKSHHTGGLADLPFAEKESKSICETYKAHVYANTQASDQAFIEALNTPAIIHLATHAVMDSVTGPYLALNEKLTLDKIQYTMTQSPLVVLSACETASGKLVTAEGAESLNKAFLSKGVKGVIASQWPVDDATMPLMMRAFYENLAVSHHPAFALSEAKRQYLGNTHTAALRNPWYWASLSFTGTDTEVIIEEKTHCTIYFITICMVVLSGVFIAKKYKKRNSR